MTKITPEIKKEFLSLQSGEEYMDFLKEHPLTYKEIIRDHEMGQKMADLIRMAPGSCGNGSGYHEELWKRK